MQNGGKGSTYVSVTPKSPHGAGDELSAVRNPNRRQRIRTALYKTSRIRRTRSAMLIFESAFMSAAFSYMDMLHPA